MTQATYVGDSQHLDMPLDATTHSFWMPVDAAEGAAKVDFGFNFILAVCTFFFVLIVGLAIAFVIKYRKRPGYTPKPSPHHSLKLEVTWSVIPIVLCGFMFWFGFSSYMTGRTMPPNANQVSVRGQKWSWTFEYPAGFNNGELHVPVGEPTVLTMRSDDVIHSFFIPAFRTKLDVVPGRYTKVWFVPTKVGEFQIFCTEYCGDLHSGMTAKVVVHTPEDYAAWVEKNNITIDSFNTPEAKGEFLYQTETCKGCHFVNGTRLLGPPLDQTYGIEHEMSDGSTLVGDENYIRESILNPNAKRQKGFEGINMTSFQGRFTDQEIDYIIAYLKSFRNQ
ncbi:MAG: cytochrome c oxidase subunit II [Planctomycetota bacterium]